MEREEALEIVEKLSKIYVQYVNYEKEILNG